MTAKLSIAAIQMVSAASVEPNLEAARRLVAQAAAAGASLVVLPEFFCLLGRRDTDKVDAREPAGDGPIQRALADIARESGVWLIGGTVPIASSEPRRIRNACLVHRPDGTPWRVGLSVCYDLRFPEYYRALGTVDLIVVPSAFTYVTGQAHWEVLLRARAIENQCWVLAPAQGGTHENGRRTWGHTMLVDPWGEVVACLPEGEGVVAGELSAARLAEVRAQLPALAHRTM